MTSNRSADALHPLRVPARNIGADQDAGRASAKTTALDVVEHLKGCLRRGEFAPGQRLAEPDVMRLTGASRGRVREALLRLATEGLVELHEFRGAVVKRMSRTEVRRSYELREVLEGLAARRAATSPLDPAARDTLQALQAELDVAATHYVFDAFVRANERYHAFIVAHADNPLLTGFLDRLSTPIFRLQFHVFYSGEAMRVSNADHQAITRAILAGDGTAAEAAMRSHVRSGLATVLGLADRYFD